MDTRPEYIKMCLKAEELQRSHKWIFGDCYSDDGISVRLVLPRQFPISGCVWVFRQDDLQAMLPLEARSYLGPIKDFAFEQEEAMRDIRRNIFVFLTMEQLWLGFIMFHLYQKRWDGESWRADV